MRYNLGWIYFTLFVALGVLMLVSGESLWYFAVDVSAGVFLLWLYQYGPWKRVPTAPVHDDTVIDLHKGHHPGGDPE
jgi:hypothetical protein